MINKTSNISNLFSLLFFSKKQQKTFILNFEET